MLPAPERRENKNVNNPTEAYIVAEVQTSKASQNTFMEHLNRSSFFPESVVQRLDDRHLSKILNIIAA